MSTIVTRAGKGSALTHAEVDANFTNLNTDKVEGQSSSVDSEIALFSGTGGKTIKRATTTGVLKATSGVISAAVAGTDYADVSTANTFTNNQVISVNSASDALRITQTGAGNALVVEDSANPDATPFVVDASGNVGIGKTPSVKLDVSGTMRSVSSTITGAAGGTITPTSDSTNQYTITALGAAATIGIPSGTPIDGQKLTIRIKDNGTARALTWTTSAGGYRIIGTTLPVTTVISKTVYIGCIYNSADSFWDVIAVAQQA